MTREWKPGDVAVATVRGEQNVRLFRTGSKRGLWKSAVIGGVGVDSMQWHGDEHVDHLRPLVVIDPEDREQVERLWRIWTSLAPDHRLAQDCMQAALREFANPTPPKPEEPTALYARIEDAEGRVWVRTATQASVWRCESVNSGGFRYLIPQDGCEDWADISAVRIISEGVTQ